MRFLVIQHLDIEPPAMIGDLLLGAGHTLHTLRSDLGESLPDDISAYSGIIVMGGPQSANDAHLPYIREELHWLADRISDGMPMLGVCLGSQLIAKAAGGSVSVSPLRELGWYPVFPASDTPGDPVFSSIPESGLTVFQWHGETFTLPDNATLLATHPEVPAQAFRLGHAQYGMQFHVEVDGPLIEQWMNAGEGERAHLGAAGLAGLHAGTAVHLQGMHAFCCRMTMNWLNLLR